MCKQSTYCISCQHLCAFSRGQELKRAKFPMLFLRKQMLRLFLDPFTLRKMFTSFLVFFLVCGLQYLRNINVKLGWCYCRPSVCISPPQCDYQLVNGVACNTIMPVGIFDSKGKLCMNNERVSITLTLIFFFLCFSKNLFFIYLRLDHDKVREIISSGSDDFTDFI